MLMIIAFIKHNKTLIATAVKTLRMSAENLFKWFKDNQIKGNKDKCHLELSTGD